MIEALVEGLGRLNEQDFARVARDRIQNLAVFSGFQHYVDPSGGMGMGGSIHDRSMYRVQHEEGLIITVDFNKGAGPMPWSGSISCIDVIANTDVVVRRTSHSFISDGEARTIFPEPREFTMRGDTQISYPVDSQVPSQSSLFEESNAMFVTEDDGEIVTSPVSDSIAVQLNEYMRKHYEDMIIQAINNRKPQEVAQNRTRIIELIGLLDSIHPERDLILPPEM